MLCPRCKQPVRDGARFCDSCGQTLDAAGGAPAAGAAGSGAAGGAAATVIRRPMGAAAPGATAPGGASAGGAGMGAGAPGGGGAGGWSPGSAGGGSGGSFGGAAAGAAAGGGAAAWAAVNSRFPGLLDRVKNILLAPNTEWPVIATEQSSVAQLFTAYVIPLSAFAALMRFLRMSVIGISIPFAGTIRTPIVSGLVGALVSFAIGLVGIYVFGLLVNALAPTFGAQRDPGQALKVAVYTATPVWVGSVLGLLPMLASLLQLAAAIYAIYLLYLGLPVLMGGPRDKAVGYTISLIVCAILLGLVLGMVGALTGGFGGFGGYGRFGGFGSSAMTQEQQQQQAAQIVGNVLGGALGADDKGKQGLGAAINGFADIGRKMEQQQAANNGANSAQNAGSGAAADSSANAQQGAAAANAMLSALGNAVAGNRKVDPVDFHALKDLLPDSLPGMQRTNAEGRSQAALGMKSSEATATYQGSGGSRAEIKIADVSAVAGLMDAAGGIAQSVTSESDAGFERNTTVSGQAAHEKYDNRSKHGDLSVIIAKRFVVDVSGDSLDMSALEQYAGAIDYSRLAAMKDVGLQQAQ
jgi:Yip1 domain